MKKLVLMITLMILVTSVISFADTQPSQPQQFAGNVVINGQPAQDGLIIEAHIDGQARESTETSDGKYGYDTVYFVTAPETGAGSGDTSTITFYIIGFDGDSYNTGVTTTLNPSAGPQLVDIEFFGAFGCGDNSCSSSESCSSCPQDCGACPVTTTTHPSSSGGGGGGGSSGGGGGSSYHTTTTSSTTSSSSSTTSTSTTTLQATNYESHSVDMNDTNETNSTCVPDWTCGEWTECVSGTQTRECVDNKGCNVEEGKPVEEQECTVQEELKSDNQQRSPNEDADNALTGQVTKTGTSNNYPKWVYGVTGVLVLGGLFIFALWKRRNV